MGPMIKKDELDAVSRLMATVAPRLVRWLKLTVPGDTAFQNYKVDSVVDGKKYDSTVRVEMRARDSGDKRAPAPRPRKKAKA